MADPASLQATLMPNRAPRLGQPGAAEAKSARAGAPQPVALDAASSGAQYNYLQHLDQCL